MNTLQDNPILNVLVRCPVCVDKACNDAPVLILKGGFDWRLGADARYHWTARDAQSGTCGTKTLYHPKGDK
jgi:hypothetical protein